MNEERDDTVRLAFLWDTTSPRFSRRGFLQTMGFAAAAGFVAACGGDDEEGGGGDSTEKALNFYNWTDYVAEDTIPGFEEQSGIKVTYDNYSSNDDMFAKIRQGASGYDLIVPTDNFVVRMKEGDLLEALDLAEIPNIKNLSPRFREAAYDPGNRYSVPWQWGTTGLGYNAELVGEEITDWDAFQLPSVEGKSSFLDESRDAYAMALVALGKDPNSVDEGDLDEATDYLIDLKKRVEQITSDYQEPLKSNSLVLAQAYSGDVFQVQAENEQVQYVIPASGGFQWVDNMCIPKGAEHVANAHTFINYILDPKVGAALTNYVQYGSPNEAALPDIDAEVRDNPLVFPPDDVLAKLAFQKDIGEEELLIADRWTKVKTA